MPPGDSPPERKKTPGDSPAPRAAARLDPEPQLTFSIKKTGELEARTGVLVSQNRWQYQKKRRVRSQNRRVSSKKNKGRVSIKKRPS